MISLQCLQSFLGFPHQQQWVTFSSQSHLPTTGQFDRKVIAELFQFCPLRKELCSGTNLVIEVVPEIHYQILHLVIWFVITSGGEGISIPLFILSSPCKKTKSCFCWVYACFYIYTYLPSHFDYFQLTKVSFFLCFSLVINAISQNF